MLGKTKNETKFDFFVHPLSLCETSEIGSGTRLWAYSHVFPGARIGKNCNVGEGVYIENRVWIGDNVTVKNGVALWNEITVEADVFIGPNAVFTNDFTPRSFIKKTTASLLRPTLIRKGATIGANATILCGVTIHEYALVGAGAVVTQDVPPHTLVLGNPARVRGRVCFCGETLKTDDFCVGCDCALQSNSVAHATKSATRT